MHETEPQPDSQAPGAAPLTVKTDQHPTQAHEEEIDPEMWCKAGPHAISLPCWLSISACP